MKCMGMCLYIIDGPLKTQNNILIGGHQKQLNKRYTSLQYVSLMISSIHKCIEIS